MKFGFPNPARSSARITYYSSAIWRMPLKNKSVRGPAIPTVAEVRGHWQEAVNEGAVLTSR